MTYLGSFLIPPEPERTDPGEQVTPDGICGMVTQRLDQAGTPAVITPESLDQARHGAALMLAAFGIAPPEDKP